MNDRDLLKTIRPLIGTQETSDDCAAVSLGDGRLLLSSTDMLHETTDFPREMTEFQKGWMSVAVSLSDIASSGAQPLYVLVAAGLDLPERLRPFMEGACSCAKTYGAQVIGGDIDAHQEFTVVTTAFGIVEESVYCSRNGAQRGDLIGVTGVLGRAQAALDGHAEFQEYLFTPKPEVERGQKLARMGATAMMDVSDGLALSLWDIAEASGKQLVIESSSLPLTDTTAYARACGLYGGGDFGLLFTFPAGFADEVRELGCSVIGSVCDGYGVICDGKSVEKRGFLHNWCE
ncbi:MAG TPA: thiamine-phosphate kinase [Methanocorpusculum sp.]|nr:thiamine-phosphate kinase [Methanocorpusculum sp.]